MTKNRMQKGALCNTITQYTTPKQSAQRITRQTNPSPQGRSPPDQPDPSLADIMEAIKGSREALEAQVAGVSVEVNLLRADLRKVSDKVTSAEGNITALQTEVKDLRNQVRDLNAVTGTLMNRADEAEGRARRSNLRILGFPERVERNAAEAFLERWISEITTQGELSPMFAIERAHRALAPPPPPGAPPRAFIAKILNYRDRDTLLKIARERGPLKFENHTVSIYPDYTRQVQEARKSFLLAKQKLRAMEIKYMLLYPAKLKVIYKGKSHFFEHPEEVWQWLDMADQVPWQSRAEGGPPRADRRRNPGRRHNNRPQGPGENSPEARFEILEDGTISATEMEQILVPATIQENLTPGNNGEPTAGLVTQVVPETGVTMVASAVGGEEEVG